MNSKILMMLIPEKRPRVPPVGNTMTEANPALFPSSYRPIVPNWSAKVALMSFLICIRSVLSICTVSLAKSRL